MIPPILHDECYQIARLQLVVHVQSVQDAEAFELTVGVAHLAGQLLDRVARAERRRPSDAADARERASGDASPRRKLLTASREMLVDLRRLVLCGEDEAIDFAAEADRIKAKAPRIAIAPLPVTPSKAVDLDLFDRGGIDILDPARLQIIRSASGRRDAHDIETQGEVAAILDAEHRLRRVLQDEAIRRGEGETELRMHETASAHEAFARVLAIGQSVEQAADRSGGPASPAPVRNIDAH